MFKLPDIFPKISSINKDRLFALLVVCILLGSGAIMQKYGKLENRYIKMLELR